MERMRLVIAVCLLLSIALIIILVVTLADEQDEKVSDNECLDVAIIGAGISGTFGAWMLGAYGVPRDKDNGLSIGIFELSDRVGGRLHSKHLASVPDINIELGGKRFHPIFHPLINKTIDMLGLPVKELPSLKGEARDMMYYLRGVRMYGKDMGKDGTPYRLQDDERMKPNQLRWHLLRTKTNYTGNRENLDILHYLATEDGVPLYKLSQEMLFPKISSMEAYKYMSESQAAPNSPGISILGVLDGDPTRWRSNYWTVTTGMDQIPKTLLHEFLNKSHRHSLHLNKQLVKIERTWRRGYRLVFQDTVTATSGRTRKIKDKQSAVYAKKVIVAVTRRSLQDIEFPSPVNMAIRTYRDAVKDTPCGRIYLIYKNPWWRNQSIKFTHVFTDLLTRRIYDEGISEKNGRAVLQAAYFCDDAATFWRQLGSLGRSSANASESIFEVNDHIVRRIHSNLAEIYNISVEEIPPPVDRVMRIWHDDVVGGAYTFWNTGYDWRKVSDTINKPSRTDDIFISSSSYVAGPYWTAWSEGALRKMMEILELINKDVV